jgi:LacI family transcriptional regulator
MVSIKDVAALAKVSDRTVSRVVSGDAQLVRPKTRKKVQKAIEQLGYVPNRAAQFMRTSRSRVIGLMTDVVATTPFSTDIVRGIQDAIEPTQYTLLSTNTAGDAAKEARGWQAFREHGIDGVLYVTMYHRELPPSTQFPDTPVVLVNCLAPSRPELSFIVPDDYRGGYDAAMHLIEKGHRKIAYVALNEHILAAKLRFSAFADAMGEARLEVRREWVVPGIEGEVLEDRLVAYDNILSVLGEKDRPTGVVCGNDEIALQVCCAAWKLGLRIPEDLSVIGFDDFQAVSTVVEPKLTTMALPYHQMGQEAAELLLKILENEAPGPVAARCRCRLVERNSVANVTSKL